MEDPELREEIEIFSLQIANQNAEFSAAGFFPIDYTLLFSVSTKNINPWVFRSLDRKKKNRKFFLSYCLPQWTKHRDKSGL